MSAITLDSLAVAPLWVTWRTVERNGKATKVPFNPMTGREARANDPSTWALRNVAEDALPRLVNGGTGGIGIELSDLGDGYRLGGIDLDTCRDPDTGVIEAWARDVLDRIATYGEVSPSETGVKLYFRYHGAALPDLRSAMGTDHGKLWQRGGGEHPPAIELHLGNRYFAVTGQHLDGTPATIETIEADALLWLIREAGPRFKGNTPRTPPQKRSDGALPPDGIL